MYLVLLRLIKIYQIDSWKLVNLDLVRLITPTSVRIWRHFSVRALRAVLFNDLWNRLSQLRSIHSSQNGVSQSWFWSRKAVKNEPDISQNRFKITPAALNLKQSSNGSQSRKNSEQKVKFIDTSSESLWYHMTERSKLKSWIRFWLQLVSHTI